MKTMRTHQEKASSKSLLRLPFVFFNFWANESRCCQHSSSALPSSVLELGPWLPRDSSTDAMDFLWVLITTGEGQEHIEQWNIEQKQRNRGVPMGGGFLKHSHGSWVITEVRFNGDRKKAPRRYFPVINWVSLHSKLRKIQKSIILNVSYLSTLLKPPEEASTAIPPGF